MNNTIKFSVDLKNSGKRLDIFLRENIKSLTRSYLKKLIENKNVKVNNSILLLPSTKVKNKDKIIVNIINQNKKNIAPKRIKLDVVYEDKHILIINKPMT